MEFRLLSLEGKSLLLQIEKKVPYVLARQIGNGPWRKKTYKVPGKLLLRNHHKTLSSNDAIRILWQAKSY